MRTRKPIGLLIEHIVCGGAGPHVWVLAVQPAAWPAVQLDFEVAGTAFCGIPLAVDGQRAAVIACAARPFTAPAVREFDRHIRSKGNRAVQMPADKASGFLLAMAPIPATQAPALFAAVPCLVEQRRQAVAQFVRAVNGAITQLRFASAVEHEVAAALAAREEGVA